MLASCKKQPVATAKLDVEVVGCSVVERANVRTCELEPGAKLRIVASAPDLRARVDTPGAAWLASRRETMGARSAIEIEVPAGAHGLYVEAGRSDAAAATRVPVDIVTRPWLAEARAKRDRGDYVGAWDYLTKNADDSEVGGALVASLMARIDLARGDIPGARQMFARAIAWHRQLGRISDAADDSFALSFALVQRSHGYAEARKVLDDIATLAERTPEGRARLPYYRASLAAELGDRRAALDLATRAEEAARDAGLAKLVRNARNLRATQLQSLGRYEEADVILDELERTSDPNSGRCEPAEIAINSGYGALRRAEVTAATQGGGALLKRAEAALTRAAAAARHERCGDPHLLGVALGNLAWTLHRAGDHVRASATLEDARRQVPAPRGTEALSWLELSGLLALEETRRPEAERLRIAREAFEQELREAQLLHLRESEWGALTGLGTALLRAKDAAAAAKRLEEAERVLDEVATFVPLGAGRGSFLRDRSESARLLVSLHLEAKQFAAALDAARRARVRMLGSVRAALRAERLDANERARLDNAVERYRAVRDEAEAARVNDWKLPADQMQAAAREREARETRAKAAIDEALAVLGVSRGRALPALARDAITLFVFRTNDATWFFVATPRGERIEVAAQRSDEDVAASLAKVLEARVSPDAKLRVLSGLAGHDIAALPGREGVLGERFAIEDSLDLGEARARNGSPETKSALVVADPLGDLPAARREGDDVARLLRAIIPAPPSVSVVLGADAHATKLRGALPQAWLFHYAGHAVWAGHEGWDSHLRLANGTSFDLADVLTLPNVPSRVVLSSCESGAAIDSAGTTSFGLAQAFVVAGSEAVLAPIRPVNDASVAAFAAAAAAELARGDDPAQAVKRASIRLGPTMKPGDRWAFRLVRP